LRLCGALKMLRTGVDQFAPERSRASDGTIGDSAHAARVSDHNPTEYHGTRWVAAMDITHDRVFLPGEYVARSLQLSRDPRIKYVIWNGQIMQSMGMDPWHWTRYTGPDPHHTHVHVSVMLTEETTLRREPPWTLPILHAFSYRPTLQQGSTGNDVKAVQAMLNVITDGQFGPNTEYAVRVFQIHTHIAVDGIVGPQSWATLRLVFN
jgi:hypothetical protein